MCKIATPISHLFERPTDANLIIGESNCLECRDVSIRTAFPKQELFHCELQPIHQMREETFRYLEKIAASKKDLKMVSFHAASACNKPVLDGYIFRPGGKQYTRDELLENAHSNFRRIKEIFGNDIDIAIENNNYYPTDAYRWVTDADFLTELVYENALRFLLDTAHAKVTANNRKIGYEVYLEGLPLCKTIQLHISRFTVEQSVARDVHGLPDAEDWVELQDLLAKHEGIRYITIEYYHNTNMLIGLLQRTRKILNGLSGKSF